MKLRYDFLTQSQLVVIRTGNLNVSFVFLTKLVDILKKDFPQATNDDIFIEHFDLPEYRQEFYGISYKYTGREESVPWKYIRHNR